MRLMVTIPTHSGSLTSATADSLFQLQRMMLHRGHSVEVEFYSGPVIADLRNVMVADFLGRPADALLMLDSDTGVTGPTFARLLDWNRPIVGCMYPKRRFNWQNAKFESASSVADVLYQATEFVGRLEGHGSGAAFEVENGFARAIHIGTGVMMIRREVFDTLKTAYPDLKNRGFSFSEFPPPRFAENWGFFNPLLDPNGPSISEDFSFCYRWRSAGGEVWADVTSAVVHVGTYKFSGNFLDYCRAVHGMTVNAGETEVSPDPANAQEAPSDAPSSAE
jgi:hypothetical protein